MVGIKKNDLSDVSSKHNAGVCTVIVTLSPHFRFLSVC